MLGTGHYRRKRIRYRDEVTGEMITRDNPPIPGKQSLASGSLIALVSPAEFSTSSWWRASLPLEGYHKAWLLWCYGKGICWEYQIATTQWTWNEFNIRSGTRKITGKTQERLKKLIWLAAQAIKAELFGGEGYEYQELALLTEMTTKNWFKTFTRHRVAMKHIFQRLDNEALLPVMRTHSKQKAIFSKQSVAKVDRKAYIPYKFDILPTLYMMVKANKTHPQVGFFVSLIPDRHSECTGGGAKGDF